MGNDASKVISGADGAFYVGTATSVAPTGLTSSLASYTNLGYYSEDGFKINLDKDVEKKHGHNGDVVLSLSKGSELTIEIAFIETSKAVLELYWGVTIAADGSWNLRPEEIRNPYPCVLDSIFGTDVTRYYFPALEVSEVKELEGKKGELIEYGVTLSAKPDSAGNVGKAWSSKVIAAPTTRTAKEEGN